MSSSEVSVVLNKNAIHVFFTVTIVMMCMICLFEVYVVLLWQQSQYHLCCTFSHSHILIFSYSLILSLIKGEEIVSGAQRIHDVALLTERAEHWKVKIIKYYCKLYTMKPHITRNIAMLHYLVMIERTALFQSLKSLLTSFLTLTSILIPMH